jgi:hypothetical protein
MSSAFTVSITSHFAVTFATTVMMDIVFLSFGGLSGREHFHRFCRMVRCLAQRFPGGTIELVGSIASVCYMSHCVSRFSPANRKTNGNKTSKQIKMA